ncbi:hypothetical protein [Streptomyces sp. NBC_01262]|uniref:hypothetical protein n=1 Tax=Streptomyces sp. NBC_01262 TaxID=2903803 RepID=UPI002E373566|nr:hypothetical protein [Streptomyces sp. NBC_01262]
MIHPDPRLEQVARERRLIGEAAARLLAGTPQRSEGKLTVASLAIESGVPRHRLYEHHAESLSQFKASAGGGPLTPNQQALQQRLEDAQARVASLEADNKLLQRRISSLSAIIAELSHEAHGENVVVLPRRRRSPTNNVP